MDVESLPHRASAVSAVTTPFDRGKYERHRSTYLAYEQRDRDESLAADAYANERQTGNYGTAAANVSGLRKYTTSIPPDPDGAGYDETAQLWFDSLGYDRSVRIKDR